MRIGIDIRALMEGKVTGVQVYVINLLRELFKQDQKNQYVLFANAFADIAERIRKFDYPNVAYRIFRYPNKIFNVTQKFFARPKVDRLLGGVDLFFSPHWRAVALSPGVPLVVTFHDLSFEIAPHFFTPWQRAWHRFMDYRAAAQRAARLIAVSESTKHDLEEIYEIPAYRIETIYPGVRIDPERQPVADVPERYFLFFGTFEPRKNLLTVLEAYKEYFQSSKHPLPLVLAGSSGWQTKFALPAGLRSSVKIFQNVSNAQKAYLYEHAAALLFPSFYEGFGFPVLEAAGLGVPVISSFATSLREIAGDFALFVNPFRPSQVAHAMVALEQDPVLALEMREKGLASSKQYDWRKTAGATLQLFQEVYEEQRNS